MNILNKITNFKKEYVTNCKQILPLDKIKKNLENKREHVSLKNYLLNPEKNGIIAEFKRESPSKGIINSISKPAKVGLDYQTSKVSAISVLTETNFFGGKNTDLMEIANKVAIPILRKDFIIDDYQIFEAKYIGASVILLIASILTKDEIKYFYNIAKSLNLEVLFEVHNKQEIDKLPYDAEIVGINNRNLKTFEVNIENSIKLSKYLPSNIVKVSESGISNIDNIQILRDNGFKGFLIGENFMSREDPGSACKEFCINL